MSVSQAPGLGMWLGLVEGSLFGCAMTTWFALQNVLKMDASEVSFEVSGHFQEPRPKSKPLYRAFRRTMTIRPSLPGSPQVCTICCWMMRGCISAMEC